MTSAFEVTGLTKKFDDKVALDDVTLQVPAGRIIGLIGRNGCGKTTLLRHVVGLYLPTKGECRTLDQDTANLGEAEMNRIGIVHQEFRFLHWMSVSQQLEYVASFYKSWDHDLQKRLEDKLELDLEAKVGSLSPGNAQKLGILLAVCHGPELLILDEPVSALDPIARASLLEFFLDLLRQESLTIVISSHILRDIEEIVDWVVCLEKGRLITDMAIDDLQERYAEWRVTCANGELPAQFDEGYILDQEVTGKQARLHIRNAGDHIDTFRTRYQAEVTSHPLNLERIFPLLLKEDA